MYGQKVESWLERFCAQGRSLWSNVSLVVVVLVCDTGIKCKGILTYIYYNLQLR